MSTNPLQMFEFNGYPVRVITGSDGEPWWLASDVCEVLSIANVGNALARLDDDEKGSIHIADGTDGNPNRAIINESGLYSLVLRSRKAEAKTFKKWVTSVVLPSIRKTGRYEAPGAQTTDKLETILEILALGHVETGKVLATMQEAQEADRKRLDDLEANLLNVANSRRPKLRKVPPYYHRFWSWCMRRSVPPEFLGTKQPAEIRLCKAIALDMGLSPERIEPQGNSEAWYFHERVMLAWEHTLFKRYGWVPPQYLPFREGA